MVTPLEFQEYFSCIFLGIENPISIPIRFKILKKWQATFGHMVYNKLQNTQFKKLLTFKFHADSK